MDIRGPPAQKSTHQMMKNSYTRFRTKLVEELFYVFAFLFDAVVQSDYLILLIALSS